LNACLSKVNSIPAEVKKYSDSSLVSYDQAISLLKYDDSSQTELAILKSSKAYLLGDRAHLFGDPRNYSLALELHKEADALKPGDEHILCGIGLNLYRIETNKKPEDRKREQYDLAYAYVTKAILCNDKVPNIYVTRGNILLALGDEESAKKDFDSALHYDQHHSDALIKKSQLALQQGDCASSMRFFKSAMIPLVDKPHLIEQHQKELDALNKKLLDKCPNLLEGDVFFNSLSDEVDRATSSYSPH
jgi:tetratricopeptide (TPR) repeat protein